MAVEFRYASEKLGAAVRSLMLPHLDEATSIASAMREIGLALKPGDDLENDEANRWRDGIFRIMSTRGVSDPGGKGLLVVRAKQLTKDEKYQFSGYVWELEAYCRGEFWGHGR